MSPDTLLALACLGAYLLGAVPFGLVLVRVFKRQDVRAQGSGNIGATNVTRVAGKALGAFTLALDAAKGAAPVLVAGALGWGRWEQALLGACAFLGHCFPVYLRFLGGKGIATGFGVILALSPPGAALAAGVFGVMFAVTRISSLSSLAGMGAVVAAAAWYGVEGRMWVLLGAMMGVVVVKHLGNIRRLFRGAEHRF